MTRRKLHPQGRIHWLFAASLLAVSSQAETGKLVVQVEDTHNRPIASLEIEIDGIGGSKLTGNDGKAILALGIASKPGEWVSFTLVKSPPGKDLAIVSPYDFRAQIPSFENKPENFVKIFVVQRGDLDALQSGTVLRDLTAKINRAEAPKSADKSAVPEDPKAALNAVAKQYGFDPDELDKQIRNWGTKTTDLYEAGLAALYERNYPKASTQLQASLARREDQLTKDQTTVEGDRKAVADAAFFLGQSLYEQGKYKESASAYQRRLKLTPDDSTVMNNLALSLDDAGDYAGAEPLYRRALAIDEKALGPDHPTVATNIDNLAGLLNDKGDYAGAEPLYRRALAIDEKALGPDHPGVARDINNLAGLLEEKGDYAGAEPLYRRALAVSEKALGPDHPSVAIRLNNLAVVLEDKGDYAGAEPLYRRALAIDEKALGPDHPGVAIDINNLALLLKEKGDYAGAESLYRRALAIDEKALGPDHPTTKTINENLDALIQAAAKKKEK